MYRTQYILNSLLAIFFLVALTIPSGYDVPYAFMLIGLGYAGYFLATKKQWIVPKPTRWLIYSILFYFGIFVLSFLVHQGRLKELNYPFEILLFIPVLLLLARFPLSFKVLAYSIPIGAILSGLAGLYDTQILHKNAAFKHMLQIQGGDICMSLGMFSLVLIFYFLQKKNHWGVLLAILGLGFGVFGSFLSTARGGWVGVPVIVLVIFYCYRQYISKKAFLVIFTLLSTLVAGTVIMPNSPIVNRINNAIHDINYYENNRPNTSLGLRFDMWKSALYIARENPILGVGQQHLVERKMQYAKEGLISRGAASFGHQHNQFLDDQSKRGVIGLVGLLAIFLFPLVFFWKTMRNNAQTQAHTLATLGVVHVLSVMAYCLSQGFFMHHSGNMFYFFVTVVLYSMLTPPMSANFRGKISAPE